MDTVINYSQRTTRTQTFTTIAAVTLSNAIAISFIALPFLWSLTNRRVLHLMEGNISVRTTALIANYADAPFAALLPAITIGLISGAIGLRSAGWIRRAAILGLAANTAALATTLLVPAFFQSYLDA